jgi:hypothetical protein
MLEVLWRFLLEMPREHGRGMTGIEITDEQPAPLLGVGQVGPPWVRFFYRRP